MITRTEKDFMQIIIMFGIFINLLFLMGCTSAKRTIYLWDGDKLYVVGQSGLIVKMRDGYVEIQSGRAILKSGEKAIVGQPSKEEYIGQWDGWDFDE